MIAFLATDIFRFIIAPAVAAGLGCWVKYRVADNQGRPITPELFSVWIELKVASMISLLIAISDVAGRTAKNPQAGVVVQYSEYLLEAAVVVPFLLLLLWLMSVVASKWRTMWGELVVPHAVALIVLVSVLLFVGGRPQVS